MLNLNNHRNLSEKITTFTPMQKANACKYVGNNFLRMSNFLFFKQSHDIHDSQTGVDGIRDIMGLVESGGMWGGHGGGRNGCLLHKLRYHMFAKC